MHDVEILHTVSGIIKTDSQGLIWNVDPSLSETIFSKSDFQNTDILDYIELCHENPVRKFPPRKRKTPVKFPTKLLQLSEYDAWFDIKFKTENITFEGQMRVITNSGHIFNLVLKITMTNIRKDLEKELEEANENSETEDFKVDSSKVLDKYEVGENIGIGGFGQVHILKVKRSKKSEEKIGKFILKHKVGKWHPPGTLEAVPLGNGYKFCNIL